MVICLKQGASFWYLVQPLPSVNPVIFCFIRTKAVFTFLVMVFIGCPWKEAVKQVFVNLFAHLIFPLAANEYTLG